jgi:PAS domain S-box-containing protein
MSGSTKHNASDGDHGYRQLFEANPHPMMVLDPQSLGFLAVNDAALAQYGYTRDEFLALDATQIRPTEDVDKAVHAIRNITRGLDQVGLWRHQRKDGTIILVEITSHGVMWDGQKAALVSAHDVTERIAAEQALKELNETLEQRVAERTAELRNSEQRFRAVFENSALGLVVTDGRGHALQYNAALDRFLGLEQVLTARRDHAADFEKVTHPDDLAVSRDVYALLDSGKSDQAQLEKRYIRSDGQVVWGRVTFSAVRDAHGELEFIVAIVEDITALRQAEEAARRHDADRARFARLISLGEMAAGLAHQLNQPLTAVVNYTQGCARRLRNGVDDQEALIHAMNEAAAQAQRAGQIIQHLRRFIAKQEPTRTPVNLNELITESVALLGDVYGRQRGIDIELDLADDLPDVPADAVQIEQVVLNLVNNGIDAVAEAQRIPDARKVFLKTQRAEAGVQVSIRDTSQSPAPEDLEALFEPFYTTKEEGMGMGLKVSRSIVEAHGGRLWASAESPTGLSFHFILPVVDA